MPIGVSMPPSCAENVIGISVFEADVPARIATLIRIGIIITTCGVLFMNALMIAVLSEHAEHRAVRAHVPQRRRPAPDRRERAGAHEPVARHHERRDRDQRVVAEAEKELLRLELLAVGFERKDGERNGEHRQHEDAGRLDRDALAREEEQRDHREQHDAQRMPIG